MSSWLTFQLCKPTTDTGEKESGPLETPIKPPGELSPSLSTRLDTQPGERQQRGTRGGLLGPATRSKGIMPGLSCLICTMKTIKIAPTLRVINMRRASAGA